MAQKPTVNIYSLLSQDASTPEGARKAGAAAAPAAGGQQTPAERAAIRAKANAEKDAAKAAAQQRADADRALAALVGPLEGFQTQKGSQPKKPAADANKKMTRQEYAVKSADGTQQWDQPRPKKNFDGERKPRSEGAPRKPHSNDNYNKRPNNNNEGTGNRPPRREFDKHSAGKTGNKFQNKRQGEGANNWGNAVTDAKNNAATDATWGDDAQTTKVEAKDAVLGDEGEPKSEPTEEAVEKKEEKPAVAAWDDEGFGKMTLQEHQKAEAERVAKLQELTGQKERRAAESVDLGKFQLVEKDNTDEKDELLKKQKKQEAKKAAGAARTGEKAVGLNDLFSVRGPRPGADRPRGPRPDGDRRGPRPEGERSPKPEGEQGQRGGNSGRQPRGPRVNPNNTKQFPDLGGNKPKPQHVK